VELADGRIASASADLTVQIWNPNHASTTLATYTGHHGAVTSLAVLANGRDIASAAWDATVQIWDPNKPDTTLATYHDDDYYLNAVVELRNGHIVSASRYGIVNIWDPKKLN
jgi:WD40 repeat protein